MVLQRVVICRGVVADSGASDGHTICLSYQDLPNKILGNLLSQIKTEQSEYIFYDLSPLGFPLVAAFLKKPWHVPFNVIDIPQHLRLSKEIFVIPFQGIDAERWYDGPVVHLFEGKVVEDVAMGLRIRLQSSVLGRGASVVAKSTVDSDCPGSYLDTLSTYVQEIAISESNHFCREWTCRLPNFGLPSLIAVAIVRRGLVGAELFLHHETDYKMWPSFAKRFCQNLGIELYDRNLSDQAVTFPLHRILSEVDQALPQLAAAINEFSDVIPVTVLREGISVPVVNN